MDDLIPRLEAATEGSDELDALVTAAKDGRTVRYNKAGIAEQILGRSQAAPHDECVLAARGSPDTPWRAYRPGVRHYTTSIDAALTLVAERFAIELHLRSNYARAEIYEWRPFGKERLIASHEDPNGNGTLALCIAALKARHVDQ